MSTEVTSKVTRTVTFVSSRGAAMSQATTDASTWGELKPVARQLGYDINTLIATERNTRMTYDNDAGLLPQEDFVIFLRPKATKSGADWSKASYSEIRAEIKRIGDPVKTFLNARFSKNWTQLKTEELQDGMSAFHGVKGVVGSIQPKAEAPARPAPAKKEVEKAPVTPDQVVTVTEVEGSVFDSVIDTLHAIHYSVGQNYPEARNLRSRIQASMDEVQAIKTEYEALSSGVETEAQKKARLLEEGKKFGLL